MSLALWILGIIGFFGTIFLVYQIIAFWDQYKLNKLREVYENEHGNGNQEETGKTEEDSGISRTRDGEAISFHGNQVSTFARRDTETDRTESDFEDESSSERPDRDESIIDSRNRESKVGNGKVKKRSKSNRFNPV